MTHNTKPISPLRRRMIEDMMLRKLSPQTQAAYIHAVKSFTRFLKRAPDTASAEELRQYQLDLVLLPTVICKIPAKFELIIPPVKGLGRWSNVVEYLHDCWAVGMWSSGMMSTYP